MVGPQNTTVDWQTHPGRVCVGAVGAFEQHSRHLPLDTDSIEGDYFARVLAEELDAALLPTVRFGTSLEQAGFRGTVTLKPETLMQVVRDVADELERQSFTRWVLINAHGGNHCLTPVVRDINRMNRPLKILLVHFWEFCDPAIASEGRGRGTEIHSGEWETSLMMALAPDLVRPGSVDMASSKGEASPLRQSDLTTFGVGHFAPEGAVGWPSLASPEKGRQIVESIRKNILAHVRDRLRRIEAQPRFSGTGGIALRPMIAGDVADGMRLKQAAGWNQTQADWEYFIEANPAGCFVAVHNGRVVGTAAGIRYGGRIGWIGMMLVDPEFRRMGIATRLMQRTLEALGDCTCVKLDATPAGRQVYEKLGFVAESGLKRMTVRALPRVETFRDSAIPLTDAGLAPASALDARAFAAAREVVLAHLLSQAPAFAWQSVRNGELRAMSLGRQGVNFHQVGPIVAESVEDAKAVASAAFGQLAGRPVVVDVPDTQVDFSEWLERLGFAEERPFCRMSRGESPRPSAPQSYFAAAGPDLG